MLVRRGYDSDPVKAWKETQNKEKVCLIINLLTPMVIICQFPCCFLFFKETVECSFGLKCITLLVQLQISIRKIK